jgi:hypothetical protein
MLKISFCTSIMNRYWQIKDTLAQNLKNNWINRNRVEFILVDFNSTDGLFEYIIQNFRKELKCGFLKYYICFTEKYWHAPKCKNTSHCLGNYDILVNLDCDNYTGPNGGMFIINKFEALPRNSIIHQGEKCYKKGNTGRICYYKEDFLNIGGYNQKMLAMSVQDTDIIKRLEMNGSTKIHINDKKYNNTIPNDKNESIKNTKEKTLNISYKEMYNYNYQIHFLSLKQKEYVANKNLDKIGCNVINILPIDLL